MNSKIIGGDYVHVVATVDTAAPAGKILYVNPANSTIVSEAAADPDVELVVTDADGHQLERTAVVVRRSSCEPGRDSSVGLIQADLLRTSGMKAVSLRVRGEEVARYEAGQAPAPVAKAALDLAAGPSPHRSSLSVADLAGIAASPGVTYSVQVRPDDSLAWNTIAVGRPTPEVELDRNQFAGATRATVRVLRTTGFEDEVLAQETFDLGV